MAGPLFRLACTPGNLDGAPAGWVSAMLQEGELALLVTTAGSTRSPPSPTASTS